jgi:Transposase DDE domain group 1
MSPGDVRSSDYGPAKSLRSALEQRECGSGSATSGPPVGWPDRRWRRENSGHLRRPSWPGPRQASRAAVDTRIGGVQLPLSPRLGTFPASTRFSTREALPRLQSTAWSKDLRTTTRGTGVVSHAGAALLRMLADRVVLTAAVSAGLARRGRSVHDRGRVLVDLAVLIADGGEAIADIDVLRHQPELFRPVASDTTVCPCLDEISRPDPPLVQQIHSGSSVPGHPRQGATDFGRHRVVIATGGWAGDGVGERAAQPADGSGVDLARHGDAVAVLGDRFLVHSQQWLHGRTLTPATWLACSSVHPQPERVTPHCPERMPGDRRTAGTTPAAIRRPRQRRRPCGDEARQGRRFSSRRSDFTSPLIRVIRASAGHTSGVTAR